MRVTLVWDGAGSMRARVDVDVLSVANGVVTVRAPGVSQRLRYRLVDGVAVDPTAPFGPYRIAMDDRARLRAEPVRDA